MRLQDDRIRQRNNVPERMLCLLRVFCLYFTLLHEGEPSRGVRAAAVLRSRTSSLKTLRSRPHAAAPAAARLRRRRRHPPLTAARKRRLAAGRARARRDMQQTQLRCHLLLSPWHIPLHRATCWHHQNVPVAQPAKRQAKCHRVSMQPELLDRHRQAAPQTRCTLQQIWSTAPHRRCNQLRPHLTHPLQLTAIMHASLRHAARRRRLAATRASTLHTARHARRRCPARARHHASPPQAARLQWSSTRRLWPLHRQELSKSRRHRARCRQAWRARRQTPLLTPAQWRRMRPQVQREARQEALLCATPRHNERLR